jgi:tetratricopeptide (TPR) repeat protein
VSAPPDLGKLLDDIAVGAVRPEVKGVDEVVRPAVVANARRLTAAWALASMILRNSGESEAADAESTRALALWDAACEAGDPGLPTPSEIEAIVVLLVQAGRAAETVTLARRAVENDPDDPRPPAALGLALLASLAPDEAGEAGEALIRSAQGWLRMGAVERAFIDARLASDLAGADPRAQLIAIRSLAGNGAAAGARARYDELLAEHPEARSPTVEAELQLVEGRPEEALASADAILSKAPGDADALGVRALALRNLGRLPDAIAAFEQAVDAGGGDRFRMTRAALLALTGQHAAALAELAELGPLPSAVPLVMLTRAEVLLGLERYADAADWFDRFLRADPGNPLALGERVVASVGQGHEIEQGAAELEALLAEPPLDPDVAAWLERSDPAQRRGIRGQLLLLRAQLHIAAEDFEAAVRVLREASESLGPQPQLTASLAQALVSCNRPDEAIAVVDAAPPFVAATPMVMVWKAVALGNLERYPEALEAITTVLSWDPGNPRLRRYRDAVLIALEQYGEAAASLQELAALMPEDPAVLGLWASALRGLGRDDEALELGRRAEELGGDVSVYETEIDVLRARKQMDEAVKVARRAVDRLDHDPKAHYLLGSTLVSVGDVEEAIESFRRSLDRDPDQPAVAAELGDALRRNGDYDEALSWLARALEKNPSSVYALGTRGQVLVAQGKRQEGLAQLREAAELAGADVPAWLLETLTMTLGAEETKEAFEEALARLDAYIAAGHREGWALAEKADTLRMLDRPTEGLEAADEALAASPGSEDILATKAHVLVDLYRPQEALEVADTALRASEAPALASNFARGARVRALAALDRHAEAMEELDRYLDAAPGERWALLWKANLLTDYHKYADAKDVLDGISPADATVDGLLGLCRNRLGYPAEAVAELERAVAGDRELWWCWAELGRAKRDASDPEGARRAFKVLVDEAEASAGTDSPLLGNAAWAACRLGDATAAVGFAHRALAIDASNQGLRLVLGSALLLAGRGLAGLDEIEAAAAAAETMPDPLRADAILADGIENLELLAAEKLLDLEQGEAKEAIGTLRQSKEALLAPASASST